MGKNKVWELKKLRNLEGVNLQMKLKALRSFKINIIRSQLRF